MDENVLHKAVIPRS